MSQFAVSPHDADPPAVEVPGLRAIVLHGQFRADLMLSALALNVVYLALSLLLFRTLLDRARVAGSLVQMGE